MLIRSANSIALPVHAATSVCWSLHPSARMLVFTPQKGKDITKLYLAAASGVFSTDKKTPNSEKKESKFKYVKEVVTGNTACLEFETEMNGIYVNGIDLISWDDEDKITEFKVLIRPLQAVNTIHEMMGKMLDKLKT